MASHNAHEQERSGDGRQRPTNPQAERPAGAPRADDPRDGVPSVGRGLDEDTGGDTISGFEPE
jgi:hypothetical protein